MATCSLNYIPERLHQNDNPLIETFSVGEFLYRRCSEKELVNPYLSISLTELSHNRSFSGTLESYPGDVLYNIDETKDIQQYNDKVVCELKIISLNPDNIYLKKFEETKNGVTHSGILTLLHEPEPCMYHHCVFRITVNEEIITYDNYDILKKLNIIRNSIRAEIASMIYIREVNQDNNVKTEDIIP